MSAGWVAKLEAVDVDFPSKDGPIELTKKVQNPNPLPIPTSSGGIGVKKKRIKTIRDQKNKGSKSG